jgi:hypothetical protein
MTLSSLLRNFGLVAAAASRPEVKQVEPGTQKFIPMEEATPEMHWLAFHQNDKKAGRRTSVFNPEHDPDSFPWPE